jgi:hypothetical protein
MWGTPAAAHSRDQIITALFLNPDHPYENLVATGILAYWTGILDWHTAAIVLIAHRPRPLKATEIITLQGPSPSSPIGGTLLSSLFSFLNLRSLQYLHYYGAFSLPSTDHDLLLVSKIIFSSSK